MAGQQQIKTLDKEAIFQKNAKNLLRQADLYYLEKKFALETEYDELKAIHSFLLKDIFCTNNCEIINFLNKKLRGALSDENIEIAELKTLQTKYRDINNYYYTQPHTWEEVDW